MRKFATILGTLAAAATVRMAGQTPVANFTVAGTLTETGKDGQAVAVPFFQSVEAWGTDALRVADMEPGVMLNITGKPELNAWVARGNTDAQAPAAAAPRPGVSAPRPAANTQTRKDIRIRAEVVEEAYVGADTVTETNGSIRSLFGVNHVSLTGRLVDDVTEKETAGGLLVYGRIAVDDRVRKGGEWTVQTDFYDFKIWRDAAEMVRGGKKGQALTIVSGSALVNRGEKQEDGSTARYPYIQAREAYLSVPRAKKVQAAAAAAPEQGVQATAASPEAAPAEQVDAPAPSPF